MHASLINFGTTPLFFLPHEKFCSLHSYELILYMKPGWLPSKPLQQIDVRIFDHDVQVMRSRLLLEEVENFQSWQRDRQLKCQYPEYFQYSGSRDSTPDGVYHSAEGKVIAFEYEIAQKSRKRYRAKIQKYLECLRRRNTLDGPKYDHVRMVCERESVFRILKEQTKIYSQFFTIQLASDFFAPMDRDPDQFH
jgi:hypothetical protein